MSRYTIWVCPVCRDQEEESEYERGCFRRSILTKIARPGA